MKISIISGSHRNPSQSEKVARHMEKTLANDFSDIDPWVYALADNPLPLWDQTIWEDNEEWNKRLAPLKQQLTESDAFIIIAPEWHGQVPAGLKNFFLMFNRFELGHKPALIVTVSSADGGAYPVAELRMSSYKNNRLCYIPEQLVLRNIEKILNDDIGGKSSDGGGSVDTDKDADEYFKERISWTLGILRGYAVALKTMRDTTEIHHEKFGNGM